MVDLVIYMICAFSNNPPPRAVSGVTGKKTTEKSFQKSFKMCGLQLCSGGGGEEGENLDKAVFTTGNGRSLANYLAKGGRKGTCLKPFWRGLCRNKTKET